LPAEPARSSAEPVTVAEASVAERRHRVLIVDDEPELCGLLADVLRRDAAVVGVAGSGQEALERLEQSRYDAILTDLRMPEMDGPTLYRAIESRWPNLADRVIFVSGDALSPSVRSFVDETGRPLIEKPFAAAEVRSAVSRVVNRFRR